jgi:hypothetical protein
VLTLSNSKALAALTTQGAESSAAFRRLEKVASTLQQGVHARLVSNEASVKEMVSVSHTQLQDILCQVKQLVQNTSTPRPTKISGIVGEVNDDKSISADNDDSATANQEIANKLDASLLESIERLGQLVHEKERTFGDDDVEYDTIIQSLGSILGPAKRHAADTTQDILARAVTQFTKRHGSHGITLNSQGMKNTSRVWQVIYDLIKMLDQTTSRRSKRKARLLERDLMFHQIPLATGSLMFKRRRTTRMEPSDAYWAGKGRQKDCVTTAAFLLNNKRNSYMIIASEYSTQYLKRQGVLSMSYLSVNPVLPTSSRVFQVVKHGSVQELREMIQGGEASLRDTDVYGCSLLHVSWACSIRDDYAVSERSGKCMTKHWPTC